jgi:hypothetical protein
MDAKKREKIIDYLSRQVNANIVFDNCPGNDAGWYEVKREAIIKILDGLIPMIKEAEKRNVNKPVEK